MASASSTLPESEPDSMESSETGGQANSTDINTSIASKTVMEHTVIANTSEKASSAKESEQIEQISRDAGHLGADQRNPLPLENISSLNTEHNVPSDEHVITAQQMSDYPVETGTYPQAPSEYPTSRSETYPNNSYMYSANQGNEQYYKDQGHSYEMTGSNSQGQHSGGYYKSGPQDGNTPNTSQYSETTGDYRNDTRYQSYTYNTEGYSQRPVDQATDQRHPVNQATDQRHPVDQAIDQRHPENSNSQVASQSDPSQVTRPNEPYNSERVSNVQQRSDWDTDGYRGQQADYNTHSYQQDSYSSEYSKQYNDYSQEKPSYNQPKDNYGYKDPQYYGQPSSYQGSYANESNYQHSRYYDEQRGDWRDGRDGDWGRERYSEPVYKHEQRGKYADFDQDSHSYQQPYNTSSPSAYEAPIYSHYPQGRSMPATGPRGDSPQHRGSGYYQGSPYSSYYSTGYGNHPQGPSERQNYPSNYDRQYGPEHPLASHTGQPPHLDPRTGRMMKVPRMGYDAKSAKHYTSSAKYSGAGSTFIQKRAAMLKQAEGIKHFQRGKASKGPQIIQPHRVSDSDPNKDKKGDKVKITEASFPKRSLEKFKIPKRKSAAISSPVKKTTHVIPALDLPKPVQDLPKQEVKVLPTPPIEEPTTSVKAKKKNQGQAKVPVAAAGENVDSVVTPPKSKTIPTVLSTLDSSTLLALAATIQKTLDQVSRYVCAAYDWI